MLSSKNLIGIFYDLFLFFMCFLEYLFCVCMFLCGYMSLWYFPPKNLYTQEKINIWLFLHFLEITSYFILILRWFPNYCILCALLNGFGGVRIPWLCTLFPNTITIIGAQFLGSFYNSFNDAHVPSFSFLVV